MAASRLTAACCLLLTLPPPTATQDGPLRNLRVDPGTRRLTWDAVAVGDGARVADVLCTKDGYPERAKAASYCQFPTLDPCRVSNFTLSYDVIEGDARRRVTAWTLYPDGPGARSRAAWAPANVTCRVRDGAALTCAWTPGAADRGDVRYRVTWTDAAREGRAAHGECPLYPGGCRVGDAGRLPPAVAVTVTASRRGRDVACARHAFAVAAVEEPGPPPRVRVRCNASLAVLSWALTSLFQRRLRYELRLRKGGGSWVTETVMEDDDDDDGDPGRGTRRKRTNEFVVHNPGTLTVRIRAGQLYRDVFGAWSEPESHECDPREYGEPRPWLTALLVATATALMLTGSALACRRWSVLDRMFPPVPRVKVPTGDAGLTDGALTSAEAPEERCPTALVSVVEHEEEAL